MVRLPHSTSPFSLDSNTRSEEMTEKCKEGKKEGAKEANSVETFSSEGSLECIAEGKSLKFKGIRDEKHFI